MPLHGLFEALAWVVAVAVFWWTRSRHLERAALPMPGRDCPIYMVQLWLDGVAGAIFVLPLAHLRAADKPDRVPDSAHV